MPSTYIKTTIPSYYVARTSSGVVQASRQSTTRAWWDSGGSGFDLHTSVEVIAESEHGDPVMARDRLELLTSINRLAMTDDVAVVAEALITRGLISAEAASDTIHIAVASVPAMDYPVTCNFKHIANPYIRDRLRKAVDELGFRLPVMCSPEELLRYDEDN